MTSNPNISNIKSNYFPSIQGVENNAGKFKKLDFAIAIILGFGGLVTTSIGICGLLKFGALSNLTQINSISMIMIGSCAVPLMIIRTITFVNTQIYKKPDVEKIAAIPSAVSANGQSVVDAPNFNATNQNLTIELPRTISSSCNNDLEEIAIETLNSIESKDIYTLLKNSLQEAIINLADKRHLLKDQFNHTVWIWAIYQIMLEGRLDEEACHPLLYLGDCCVKDAITIKRDSLTCNTIDWFSAHGLPCYPVTLKKKINELSDQEKSMVFHVIECEGEAEEKILDVIIGLSEIVKPLQARYPFFASGNNINPIIYSRGENTRDFLPSIIFGLLKKIIPEYTTKIDDLYDPDCSKTICSLLVLDLLYSAEVDLNNNCLHIKKLKIQFGPIDSLPFFDPKIANFLINDLTSFSYEDSDVVTTQPFDLAKILKEMDRSTFHKLTKKVKKGEKLDKIIEILLIPITKLILDRYYAQFLSSYVQKQQFSQKIPAISSKKVAYHNSKKSQVLIKNKNQKIQNDIFGNRFKSEIERHFTIHFSWNLAGSCVLSAILQAIEPNIDYSKNTNAGYQRIYQIRDKLADYLLSKEKEFITYFPTVDDFYSHVTYLRGELTYLKDLDLLALAEILGRPIFVYKKKVETFFISDTGTLLPSFTFGERLVGPPIHLYDDCDHYKLITSK